jgi:AcrR family transcriptional regulator
MSNARSPRLRERRKLETWTTIHEAAASLALQGDVRRATVEAIADTVGISPRTFFNYFQTKEDAILGLREPLLDPELAAGLTVDKDLLGQVSRLLVSVARTAVGDTDASRRRELMARYPDLLKRQMECMAKAEALVREAVAQLLSDDPSWSTGAEGFSAEETTRMLVMLAAVPTRFSASAPDRDPTRGLNPDDLGPSLALFHHLQRKLS